MSAAAGHPTRPLQLDDIADLRAYERVRDDYRRRVIELKRRRRVPLGAVVSLVFENAETVRFQVQEMARAERITTDEGILRELDVYNRLLPGNGELSATLFIELTSDAELREWLPKLVGIETAIGIELASGAVVASVPERSHAEALTREETTPAVHYVRFAFAPAQVTALAEGPAALVARHPAYQARTPLDDDTRTELAVDLAERLPLAPPG
ncbi:MAG: DUF3501 family protein [Acidimicrobiales bacterium]